MRTLTDMASLAARSLAETVWPTRCIGCDMPGTLLCPECAARLPAIDLSSACPLCGAPWGWLTCTECTDPHPPDEDDPARDLLGERPTRFSFTAARAALFYEGFARRLVTSYKDGGERRLDRLLACLLMQTARADREQHPPAELPLEPVREDWTSWADAIVGVPSRADAVRRRGFDHLDALAELLSEWTGLPHNRALGHAADVADQRQLGFHERHDNLAGSFRTVPLANVRGKRILLIDDVMTTGATTSAAAAALLEGGAEEVRAVVVARVRPT